MFDMTLPIHDPVLIFALVMLIVLVAPLVFTRLRVPGLVGLILCGAVVGPSGLGLLERDNTMVLLGTVGLLYLMFVAGLALDLTQFHKLRNRSVAFGLLSFFIPQTMGVVSGLYLLGYSLPTSLLLGSIVGSHTLLAYPIASRLEITKNTAVIMTMGGTIVTDMLALLLLAVVTGSTEGALTLGFWLRFFGLILLYLLLVLVGLPRLSRWFLRSVRSDPNIAFVFLVTALFVTAYLASLAGLAPIIGAFLAGLVLNRLVPEIGPLMSRIKFVGETLFIPFFLLSVGMLVDFGVLVANLEVWQSAAIFTLIVVVGKLAAAKACQHFYRHSRDEGWVIFGLSVPQAAATLAVTLVGFNLGLFDQTAVNAVVVMILLTCMLGPWLVERYGRRVARAEEQRPYQPAGAPQRILVPMSNPATAENLMDLALAIRRPDSQEAIFPLVVVSGEGEVQEKVAAGERILSRTVLHAVSADVPVIPMTRIDQDVVSGIGRAVAERRISHIVIGWGGQSSPRQRIFGSILDRFLDVSQETVLVCKLDHPINTMQRVVLTVPPLAEREPGFDEALRTVKLLAYRIGAVLTVVLDHRCQSVVEEHLQAAKPDLPVTFQPLDSYRRLLPHLTATVTAEDLVVLLSVREHQLSWHPALDRLPRLFAQRFPTTDFLVLYTSQKEPAQGEEHVRVPVGSARMTLPPVRATLNLPAMPPTAALHTIMADAFPDEPAVLQAITGQLLQDREMQVPEIAPGVVLLHAHTPLLTSQMLFVGTSKAGLRFEHLPEPAYVLLVLLNPIELPPEEHLHTLAELAHAVREAQLRGNPDGLVEEEALLEVLGRRSILRASPAFR